MQIQNSSITDLIRAFPGQATTRRPALQRTPDRPNWAKPALPDATKPKPNHKPEIKPNDITVRPGIAARPQNTRQPIPQITGAPSPTPQLTPADNVDRPQGPTHLTLEGFVQAWNQADSTYDLNSDGTVNMQDLLEFLNHLDKYNPDLAAAAQPVGALADTAKLTSADGIGPAKSATPGKPGTALGDAMFDHLSKAGFASKPPENIHELVGTLNISPKNSDLALKQLASKYPDGLGINVIG